MFVLPYLRTRICFVSNQFICCVWSHDVFDPYAIDTLGTKWLHYKFPICLKATCVTSKYILHITLCQIYFWQSSQFKTCHFCPTGRKNMSFHLLGTISLLLKAGTTSACLINQLKPKSMSYKDVWINCRKRRHNASTTKRRALHRDLVKSPN